jgi:hypothetical protein
MSRPARGIAWRAMSRRIAALAAVLALAVAGPLAGCGSSSSSSDSAAGAQTAYAPVKAELLALGTAIGAAVTGAPKQTDATLATQFDSLAARASTQIDKLQAIEVPSSAQAAATKLHDALTKATGDLSDIATAAKAHDASAARIAAEKLVTDSAAVKSARTAFEQQLKAAQ